MSKKTGPQANAPVVRRLVVDRCGSTNRERSEAMMADWVSRQRRADPAGDYETISGRTLANMLHGKHCYESSFVYLAKFLGVAPFVLHLDSRPDSLAAEVERHRAAIPPAAYYQPERVIRAAGEAVWSAGHLLRDIGTRLPQLDRPLAAAAARLACNVCDAAWMFGHAGYDRVAAVWSAMHVANQIVAHFRLQYEPEGDALQAALLHNVPDAGGIAYCDLYAELKPWQAAAAQKNYDLAAVHSRALIAAKGGETAAAEEYDAMVCQLHCALRVEAQAGLATAEALNDELDEHRRAATDPYRRASSLMTSGLYHAHPFSAGCAGRYRPGAADAAFGQAYQVLRSVHGGEPHHLTGSALYHLLRNDPRKIADEALVEEFLGITAATCVGYSELVGFAEGRAFVQSRRKARLYLLPDGSGHGPE